ncbi:lysophospholipase [Vibrio ishigakensis]|uniref:Lysophospholipase n=1 Tax=Vibrio ishigakensis TaxID=1481914 RepID=A0A0B8NNC5_9VIBR|nr:alpha/beta fold hydrolase [Vibrio ishigakensis]GAM55516.1 lysophospholipase [Vibrio ishigakensis]
MRLRTYIALFSVLTLALVGCSSTPSTALNQSDEYYDYIQPTYSEYLAETEQWLVENRGYMSDEHDKEIAMNMPFELKPESETNKAILLVHGLGDSPYSFSDIGKTLQQQGFYVQAVLLPGHGSKPSDLMLPSYQDWQTMVDHYANLLKQEYDEVWLGGFSTGGNLVTINALEQGDVEGLVLFSPGFQSKAPFMEKLAPIAALFIDGYNTEEDNAARYSSAPLNGAIAYSESASKLRSLLKEKQVTVPTLIALSEADSVVDPIAVKTMYEERFTHPNNQLLWYGESEVALPSATSLSMKIDSMQISTGSHMSPLFAPSNDYYGKNGEYRMCLNSMDKESTTFCEQGGDVWWSAWGYEEEGKVHARLTWNPYYQELTQSLATVTES